MHPLFAAILARSMVFFVSLPGCPFCIKLEATLNKFKVPFCKYTMERSDDVRDDLDVGNASFPIVFVGGRYIGGFREAKNHPMLNAMGVNEQTAVNNL